MPHDRDLGHPAPGRAAPPWPGPCAQSRPDWGRLGVSVASFGRGGVTASWPGLGRDDVAHDVDLAEFAIGFPVCFEYIVQDSSYGVFAGRFDDPLQWPGCCVVAPCLANPVAALIVARASALRAPRTPQQRSPPAPDSRDWVATTRQRAPSCSPTNANSRTASNPRRCSPAVSVIDRSAW